MHGNTKIKVIERTYTNLNSTA